MANKHDQDANNKKSELEKLFIAQKINQAQLAQQEKEMRLRMQAEVKAEHYHELNQKAKPVWDEFYKLVDDILHRSMNGYDSFQSASSGMFQFLQKRGDALRAQAPIALGQLFDFISGDNIVGFVFSQTLSPLGTQIAQGVSDCIFGHAVELDCCIDFVKDKDAQGKALETGYVGTQHLARRDGQKLTHEQVIEFEAEVVVWLSEKGYKPAQPEDPSRFINKKDGTPLTAKQFEKLRPDFEKYLSKGNDIKARLLENMDSEPLSPLRPR